MDRWVLHQGLFAPQACYQSSHFSEQESLKTFAVSAGLVANRCSAREVMWARIRNRTPLLRHAPGKDGAVSFRMPCNVPASPYCTGSFAYWRGHRASKKKLLHDICV